jgi:hypothetical protein
LQYNRLQAITEVDTLVKIEGTLNELRALLGDAERATTSVVETVEAVKPAVKKTRRKLSQWQRYIKNRANHIKYPRGPKKGRLDLAKMSKAFKRSKK